MEFKLQLNGGGHNKALRSYGTGRGDRRARLFLTPAPDNTDPEEAVLEAVRYQLKTRHCKMPLLG
eukprot:7884909-Alexandrium_andersonii.AAC.1